MNWVPQPKTASRMIKIHTTKGWYLSGWFMPKVYIYYEPLLSVGNHPYYIVIYHYSPLALLAIHKHELNVNKPLIICEPLINSEYAIPNHYQHLSTIIINHCRPSFIVIHYHSLWFIMHVSSCLCFRARSSKKAKSSIMRSLGCQRVAQLHRGRCWATEDDVPRPWQGFVAGPADIRAAAWNRFGASAGSKMMLLT